MSPRKILIGVLLGLALRAPCAAAPKPPLGVPAPTTGTGGAAKPAAAKTGGLSPGTPSPWGIPPELRKKGARRAMWYAQMVATEAAMSFSPRAAASHVAYDQTIPLRSDRQALGTRVIFPEGGNRSDGVTSNSFELARGGVATSNLILGVAFPLTDVDTLSFDSSFYARDGNPTLARSYGATLPYGAFVDQSRKTQFSIPGFCPQFHRMTWHREGSRHRFRVAVGDYTPFVWSPVEGSPWRNYIDLNQLTFRPFAANTSVMAFGTIYPPDRQFGPVRPELRGFDAYLKSGDFEVEVLDGRQETHPSAPFDVWRFRQAVGGRIGVDRPDWGLGYSMFHMYGDNIAVIADPTSATVPAGSEGLWSVDGSLRVLGNLSAYGALASTTFRRNGISYNEKNQALVAGLFLKGWPGKRGDARLQYQTIGANYDALNVRNQISYPANYSMWIAEARYPFQGGTVYLSGRHYNQLQPDIAQRGTSFATNDVFFPSNRNNQGKGGIFDWVAGAEFDIPKTPCRLYFSWEEVAFRRGATPGLNFSATHRSVGQQMAMMRIQATPEVAVHLGYAFFHAGGTIGAFNRNILNKESQSIPRLGVTWKPDPDTSAYLMLQKFQYTDGLAISGGLNNYDASTVILEVQTRFGGEF